MQQNQEQEEGQSIANVDDVPAGELELIFKGARPDHVEADAPSQRGKKQSAAVLVISFEAIIPEASAGPLLMLMREHAFRVALKQPESVSR